VLAFEMARQLAAAGYELGLLAFIDGGIGGDSGPALPKPYYYWKVFVRKICKIAFKFTDALNEGPREFIRNRFGHMRFLWRMRHLKSDSELTLEEALLLSERAYSPHHYNGSALLIRFRNEARKFGPNPLMGWGTVLAERLEVIDAPGGHTTGMDSDFAPHLASILEVRMAALEKSVV
jgi:thioesterase domain-containing protein